MTNGNIAVSGGARKERPPLSQHAAIGLLCIELVAILFLLAAWLLQPRLTVAIHQGVEGAPLKKVIERYLEHYRGSIQVVQLPYEELLEAELQSVSGAVGATPYDVIMLDDPWLPALLEGRCENPPCERLRRIEIPSEDQTDFLDLTVARHPYVAAPAADQHSPVYALPFVGNFQLFSYRNSYPMSWEEVLALGADPSASGPGSGVGYIMRSGFGNSVVTDLLPLLWDAQPDAIRPECLNALDEGRASKAFQQVADLMQKQGFASSSVNDFDVAVRMLAGGENSIVWSAWAMSLQKLKDNGFEQAQGLQFAHLPGGRWEMGQWLLAIPANAPHPTQAERLIRFATSSEQLAMARDDNNPPPRQSVLRRPDTDAKYATLRHQHLLEKARPRTRSPQWTRIENELASALSQVASGAIEPEDAVRRINARLAVKANDGSPPVEKCPNQAPSGEPATAARPQE